VLGRETVEAMLDEADALGSQSVVNAIQIGFNEFTRKCSKKRLNINSFNNKGIAKIILGLGRGKKDRDKRSDEKRRDWQRQKQRLIRVKD
jgi:hypothetical protein